jgi:23S rRNA (uridine2552-2'-O)-methyltransferase
MARSKSSKTWLKEHFNDEYVKRAQQDGVRSRAVYKLMELQEKDKLLKPGMTVVDLGAAPGGWSQYARDEVGLKGNVIGLDILPIDPIAGVTFIQGDFREQSVYDELLATMNNQQCDLVMSDIAPNMSGNKGVDIPRAMYLCELAFGFAKQVLKPKGDFVMKFFHGEGWDALLKEIRQNFDKVVIRKPKASRPRSKEAYLLAKSYKV